MKMLLEFKRTEDGYIANLDKLSEFSVRLAENGKQIESLPLVLKNFVNDWELENSVKSEKYRSEFPYILRIKSRSFYQASIYRIQEVFETNQLKQIDLEEIHAINQKEFNSMTRELKLLSSQ
ncbi:hypothetical protein [uncultured Vagococcus sp.]|uniref:hypothetical protein n=1 Tax=uncultured Vagococcus sp. TaxID=189676 RepID=UPI0028D14117|nr:hypothetical protein [uncultured Vagococcus sp.]